MQCFDDNDPTGPANPEKQPKEPTSTDRRSLWSYTVELCRTDSQLVLEIYEGEGNVRYCFEKDLRPEQKDFEKADEAELEKQALEWLLLRFHRNPSPNKRAGSD